MLQKTLAKIKNTFVFKKEVFMGLFLVLFVLGAILTPFSISSQEPAFAHAATGRTGAENAAVVSGADCNNWWDMSDDRCIVNAFYYIIYYPTTLFLALTGLMFDAATALTLSSQVISGGDVVRTGWEMARNITNGVFLLVILYIAISLILQMGVRNAKSILVKLIIVALLINFSLFFSRVVIDASNMVGFAFYSHMGEMKTDDIIVDPSIGVHPRNLSANIANAFDPQELFGEDMYKKLGKGTDVNMSVWIFLIIIAAVLTFLVAVTLITVALYFIVRIVVLWLLMALAPLAFLAFILPKTQQYGAKWFQMLISQAFLVPIFLGMLYFVITFIQVQKIDGFLNSAHNDYFLIIVRIVLTSIFYFIMIGALGTVAKMASGEAGRKTPEFGKFVGGAVLGAGAATIGMAGQKFIGGGADKLSRTRLGNSKMIRKRLDKAASANYDFRNTGIGNAMSKSGYSFSKGKSDGGRRKQLEADAKHWGDMYDKASTDQERMEILDKMPEKIAQQRYSRISHDDRASLRHSAGQSANKKFGKKIESFHTSFMSETGVPGTSPEAQKAVEEEKQKRTKRAEEKRLREQEKSEKEERERGRKNRVASVQKKLTDPSQTATHSEIKEMVENSGKEITDLDGATIVGSQDIMNNLSMGQISEIVKSGKLTNVQYEALGAHLNYGGSDYIKKAINSDPKVKGHLGL